MTTGHSPKLCHKCGATVSPFSENCETCTIYDQWLLAIETSNTDELMQNLKKEHLVLMVHYIKRLREKLRQPRKKRNGHMKPHDFDFALQEIEKTARGLELTSIEAIGVLEMVKQSFIEEMFYDDYDKNQDGDFEDWDESQNP